MPSKIQMTIMTYNGRYLEYRRYFHEIPAVFKDFLVVIKLYLTSYGIEPQYLFHESMFHFLIFCIFLYDENNRYLKKNM